VRVASASLLFSSALVFIVVDILFGWMFWVTLFFSLLQSFSSAQDSTLLSTVTGDDKMMESVSNAVAILLVTAALHCCAAPTSFYFYFLLVSPLAVVVSFLGKPLHNSLLSRTTATTALGCIFSRMDLPTFSRHSNWLLLLLLLLLLLHHLAFQVQNTHSTRLQSCGLSLTTTHLPTLSFIINVLCCC